VNLLTLLHLIDGLIAIPDLLLLLIAGSDWTHLWIDCCGIYCWIGFNYCYSININFIVKNVSPEYIFNMYSKSLLSRWNNWAVHLLSIWGFGSSVTMILFLILTLSSTIWPHYPPRPSSPSNLLLPPPPPHHGYFFPSADLCKSCHRKNWLEGANTAFSSNDPDLTLECFWGGALIGLHIIWELVLSSGCLMI